MGKTFCITSPLYYPHPGGYESYVRRLSTELVKQGHKVIIVTHKLNKNMPDKEIEETGATVIRLDSTLFLDGRYPFYKINKTNRQIFTLLKKTDIDYFVINTRFYTISNKIAKLANKKNKKPILIDHGSAHLVLGNKLIDPIVQAVEHFLTFLLRKYRIDYYGISKESSKWLKHFKIESKGEIPNAIDIDEFNNKASKLNARKKFNISPSSFVVYFVGRYTVEKGVPNLLKAIENIKNENIEYIFTGKGPYDNAINDASNNYNIHNTGPLESENVAAIMKQSDVLCLPSRSEGFCVVLLEAAACKLPTIITKVGIAEELINDESFGYLLNSMNWYEINNKILEAYGNRKNKSIIGENVYNKTLNLYNWENATSKLIDACNKSLI